MSTEYHTWDMADGSRSRIYDMLSNLIVPRPIAFVSTVGPGGPNLAPFSFFMAGGPNPPSLAICIVRNKDGSKKATLENIEANGEFVVNLVTAEMAEGMNKTGVDYADRASKWGIGGFEAEASQHVVPERVAVSPVHFECRSFEIVHHGQSSYVIAEIVLAHIASHLYDLETSKWARFEPIARLGGAEYYDLAGGKVFEMTRPVVTVPTSIDQGSDV